MMIRRAENGDLTGLNKLLQQVFMVHHNGRADLFKPNAKNTQTKRFFRLSLITKPRFSWQWMKRMKFYEKCGLVPQKVGMEKIL